jgi:lipoprotein-releasing system ATP-binding protein
MSDPLLEVRGLCRSYRTGPRRIDVLRQLELQVAQGESVAIVGQSGVGKSTLLHLLGGLDRAESGRLLFRGRDMHAVTPRELAAYRNREIGFVFQFHYLLPEFSALENVEMPFRIGRLHQGIRERAREMLVRMGLEERLDHRPSALSGGEQQRVAIARALVASPALVLADEPTGNLDPHTGDRVFRVLTELQQERGFSLVLATHNERLARACDRVLRLEEGRLHPLGQAEARAYFDGGEPH